VIAYDPQTSAREAVSDMEETDYLAKTEEEPLDAKVKRNRPRLSRVDGNHFIIPG
jgi:hypothetical protein